MKLKLSRVHLIIRMLINQTNNQRFMFWNLFKNKKKEKYLVANKQEEILPQKRKDVDWIRYFKNEETDNRGRYHKDILQFDDDLIECKHDFIQWIFPTIERSISHPEVPTIDENFKEQFQKDEKAKSNYCKSCQLYLNYMGFRCENGNIQCIKSGRIYELPHHNHLRITRMLNSLNQVGNNKCSANIYQALMKEIRGDSDRIDENTLEYWRNTQKVNRKHDILIGAIAGDIIGSVYEFNPIKSIDFPLFKQYSRFTDDTVMTVANADWLLTNESLLGIMQEYGNNYKAAGYGGMFRGWLMSANPQPYNSFGNGSAMRVSPVGWAFDTLEETLEKAKESAEITHNHPEGIKGAQSVAACIYLARTGKSKQEIKEYIETTFGYDLSKTCEEIRPIYSFSGSCQGTVPASIIAFLDSTSFEHAIRLSISLGGDADTMGAITGSIAEAYYQEVPEGIRKEVIKRLPEEFINVMESFYEKFVMDKLGKR